MLIQKISKFKKLSSSEMKLFIESWFTLGIIRAAILTISFKRLTRSLNQQQGDIKIAPLSSRDMRTAKIVGRMIVRAANNTPWESACLAQSLTAYNMLKKRGIPGVFYLGVMKDEYGSGDLSAHAWSQCGDAVITGYSGHESFTAVSIFQWEIS